MQIDKEKRDLNEGEIEAISRIFSQNKEKSEQLFNLLNIDNDPNLLNSLEIYFILKRNLEGKTNTDFIKYMEMIFMDNDENFNKYISKLLNGTESELNNQGLSYILFGGVRGAIRKNIQRYDSLVKYTKILMLTALWQFFFIILFSTRETARIFGIFAIIFQLINDFSTSRKTFNEDVYKSMGGSL